MPIDVAPVIIRSEKFLPAIIKLMECKVGIWPLSVAHTLLLIWVLCSLIRGLKICYAEYKARKAHKTYPKIVTEQLKRVSSRFDKPYKIIISPKVSQPYTAGIFKPVIYLPYIEYSDAELYYILLHEVQHIKSLGNPKRLIFLLVETIFWWNPLAYIAADEFELLTEYNCDYRATANMDERAIVDYLGTIVSVLKRLDPDEGKAKTKLAVMFAQTDNPTQRFEVLLRRNDRKPRRIRYAVLLLMVLIFVMSFFVIIQPYYSAPTVSYGLDMPITQDNSYIMFMEDSYYLVVNDDYVYKLTESDLDRPPCNSLMIIGE